ncbi:MAG: molybdate ABC transporter substrate-binding protein [Dehalococcoidia bacterium]
MARAISRRRAGVAALLLVASMLASCGTGAAPASRAAGEPLGGRVTVFAASSLTDVYRTIGVAFQQAHPGVTVEFNFGASSALAAQIEQGAPADVYASADEANMRKVAERDLIAGAPVTFARNRPVIVVPAANRAAIASPKDLAKPGVKLVLAGPEVPIGRYARQIIDRLAADPAYGAAFRDATLRNLVSNEANVRAVLTKVELGEADAGIVYHTDARAAGERVKAVDLPDTANVIATYPVGVVAASKNPDAARAFVTFVTGPEGQRLLADAGFDAAR